MFQCTGFDEGPGRARPYFSVKNSRFCRLPGVAALITLKRVRLETLYGKSERHCMESQNRSVPYIEISGFEV